MMMMLTSSFLYDTHWVSDSDTEHYVNFLKDTLVGFVLCEQHSTSGVMFYLQPWILELCKFAFKHKRNHFKILNIKLANTYYCKWKYARLMPGSPSPISWV